MDTVKVSERTIQLRGHLYTHLILQELVPSNGRSDDLNCLLFELQDEWNYKYAWGGREVEYSLRLRPVDEERAESSDSKEKMVLESSTPREAMLSDSSCSVEAVLYGAMTEMADLSCQDDDLYEIAELPTKHIMLREGEMVQPLVQRAIKRHVVTLGLPYEDAFPYLPALLADLTPSAPLRHLALFPSTLREVKVKHSDLELLVNALVKSTSSSRVDGLLLWLPYNILLDVQSSMAGLWSSMTYVGIKETLSNTLVVTDRITREEQAMGSNACKAKQIWVDWYLAKYLSELMWKTFARLDLRKPRPVKHYPDDNFGNDVIRLLDLGRVDLIDLGLPVSSTQDLARLCDSKLHARIRILRLDFDFDCFDEAWNHLILHDSSTIEFFDCSFNRASKSGSHDFNLKGLAGTKPPAALTALRVKFCTIPKTFVSTDIAANVASYISSPAASKLVYLDFTGVGLSPFEGSALADWKVANSLLNNFDLCTFNFPFIETAAESYAITLLRRNRFYRDSQLLNEPQIKPNVAKLFLCGHGEVGKTTLRQALQSTSRTGMCCLNSRPDRTLGMETHHLSLQHQHKKLLICDLAGQKEFHVFHHYFMNASVNDIFIVVCKYNTCSSIDQFRLQLEYWLRFIASHRSTRKKNFNDSDATHSEGKPKVIVVVNFFQQETGADAITREWTSPSMQRFSEVLDFAAGTQQHNRYKNLVGLNAKTRRYGVRELKQRLESLLSDFDIGALPIPKLCYDISENLTQGPSKIRLCCITWVSGKGKFRLLTSYKEVLRAVSKEAAGDLSARVQAALQELHMQGYIIFFPTEGTDAAYGRSNNMKGESVEESSTNSTLVITDTNWFCSKLVGSLLAGGPNGSCSWKWKVEDIKRMLRRQGCAEDQLGEILRYLERLELCVCLDSVPGAEKGYLLFPALAEDEKEIPKESNATFIGRRIMCKDTSIHLIPFGVFTRLQVKLHKAYAANHSFEIGHGWISFLKGPVRAVVRYGGNVISGAWEDRQWIDILLFCLKIHVKNIPPSYVSNMESTAVCRTGDMNDPKLKAAETLLGEIRSQLYATCNEGGLGGIPTVTTEEMVLQNETDSSDSCRLSDVLARVRAQGLLESYQEWKPSSQPPVTHVLDLLLPKEMEGLMRGWLDVLESIKEEFCEGSEDDGCHDVELDQAPKKDESTDAKYTSPDSAIIESRLKSHVDSVCQKLECRIESGVQLIREDIRNLGEKLLEEQQKILADCSTRLLRDELNKDSAYPRYPYLEVEEGKLAPLWKAREAVFGGRTLTLHFLCETVGGPHPVEGQKGKKVTIDWKPWVRKTAGVMVPALKMICCLARLAALAYLPSAAVFIPSPEVLVSGLGIEKEALQHVILPRALEAFLNSVPDVNFKELIGCRPKEQEVQEWVAAILENREVDMWADFGLKPVIGSDDVQSDHHRLLWVCEHHARHKTELRRLKNPYRSS